MPETVSTWAGLIELSHRRDGILVIVRPPGGSPFVCILGAIPHDAEVAQLAIFDPDSPIPYTSVVPSHFREGLIVEEAGTQLWEGR